MGQTAATADRFLGCLLGQAVGDAVGAAYEGLTADHIYWHFGPAVELVKNPDGDPLFYTDDTQMMIGVAECLIERGGIEEDCLCRFFVENYQPARGYGQGARRVLEAMASDDDWRTLTATLFPGGSLGNGAAMRAAPIGLLFCDDLERVAEQARLSALPTHIHPIGIEGAQLLALAVALVVRAPTFERRDFYRELIAHAQDDEFRWQLEAASKLRAHHSLGFLGNSLEAHRSVVTAIACFTASPGNYEEVIARAIALGNDTDTLAAMAGALAGAHLGSASLPAGLLDKLENQGKGRDYIATLASRLHERFSSQRE